MPLLEAKKREKFFISSDVPHTRPAAARLPAVYFNKPTYGKRMT